MPCPWIHLQIQFVRRVTKGTENTSLIRNENKQIFLDIRSNNKWCSLAHYDFPHQKKLIQPHPHGFSRQTKKNDREQKDW